MAKKTFEEKAKEDGLNVKISCVSPMDDEELYDFRIINIANSYGYEAQSMQCIEECAELIQAINKFWRKTLDCGARKTLPNIDLLLVSRDFTNLVEELADVQIMISQMLYLLQIDNKGFGALMENKLNRQIDRIMNERGGNT